MSTLRIRQLVFASADHADIERFRQVLALGQGFIDPGVATFGLTNGVFALGDQFLEIVVPVQSDTAAGRFMARSQGVGGYMAIFQTPDLKRVRQTADALNIRRVWNIDLPDIAASHLHPADIGAGIVSIDEVRPKGSWRWGGPDWSEQSKPGGLTGLEIVAVSPHEMSTKWGQVLDAPAEAQGHGVYQIQTDDGPILFVPGDRDYLSQYTLSHPDLDECLSRAAEQEWACTSDSFQFAGVKVQLTAIDPAPTHVKSPIQV